MSSHWYQLSTKYVIQSCLSVVFGVSRETQYMPSMFAISASGATPDKIRDKMIWFHALHDLRRYTVPRCWAPHTQTQNNVRYTGDDDTPLKYKPRDSARSALLFKSVRNRRSGLALQLHPPEGYNTALRPLTGAAEYAWGAGWR